MDSEDVSGISDLAISIYTWIMYSVACQIINVFGILTNIINIVCFAKQGFRDSVNISLLGLSVSDLGSITTLVWACICSTPAVLEADLPFDPMEVAYLTTTTAHLSFARVSSCITAMITMERCLCITAPLKIKSIITPKRTAVITICIFIIFFCSCAPACFVNSLGMKFSPLRNKTLIGLVSTPDRQQVEMISFAVNNFFIPIVAFVIIVANTTILSIKLQNKTKWRRVQITGAQDDKVSKRNQKAAKMVVMISALFIACFVPLSIFMLALGFLPVLSVGGKYFSISRIIAGLGYVLESINSSMNIFIYFHMSSKYRSTFFKIFGNESNNTQDSN